jgi:hypothetical protein
MNYAALYKPSALDGSFRIIQSDLIVVFSLHFAISQHLTPQELT